MCEYPEGFGYFQLKVKVNPHYSGLSHGKCIGYLTGNPETGQGQGQFYRITMSSWTKLPLCSAILPTLVDSLDCLSSRAPNGCSGSRLHMPTTSMQKEEINSVLCPILRSGLTPIDSLEREEYLNSFSENYGYSLILPQTWQVIVFRLECGIRNHNNELYIFCYIKIHQST